MTRYPERIVCLTEETTETLYLLGEGWRIAGISGYTERPARARKEKPVVSAFTTAKIDEITRLEPDLVLGFSDLQADIAAELVRQGIEVHVFNQRTIEGIIRMIAMLGAMVGCTVKAEQLIDELVGQLEKIRESTLQFPSRPMVYFEEWDEPLISGIQWVSELVEIAGGEDCFQGLAKKALAADRVIRDPQEVVRRHPDIIVGSWCGKKFQQDKVTSRPGWDAIPAVLNNHVYEVRSADILQPGPAALTDGVKQLHDFILLWHKMKSEN